MHLCVSLLPDKQSTAVSPDSFSSWSIFFFSKRLSSFFPPITNCFLRRCVLSFSLLHAFILSPLLQIFFPPHLSVRLLESFLSLFSLICEFGCHWDSFFLFTTILSYVNKEHNLVCPSPSDLYPICAGHQNSVGSGIF